MPASYVDLLLSIVYMWELQNQVQPYMEHPTNVESGILSILASQNSKDGLDQLVQIEHRYDMSLLSQAHISVILLNT